MSGTIEYQKMNENLLMADGHAMKAPEDYQNPGKNCIRCWWIV